MMTIEVGRHLNALRDEATRKFETTTRGDGVVLYVSRSSGPQDREAVQAQCRAAVTALLPAARHDTIAAAAAAREPARIGDLRDGYSWDGTADVLLACERAQPVIAAILAESARARAAAYEAYRLACEQGVAVPPPA